MHTAIMRSQKMIGTITGASVIAQLLDFTSLAVGSAFTLHTL